MTIKGLKELKTKLKGYETQVDAKTRFVLNSVALRMANSAKERIQSSESKGKAYKRGKNTHYASVAGAFPNSDSGNLVSNIFSEVVQGGRPVAKFGVRGVPYSYALEFGTSKMEARPFIKPTFNKFKKDIIKDLYRELKGIIK